MKREWRCALIMCLLSFILVPLSCAVSAEIYKWKDKDGRIHYSDSPPPDDVENAEVKKFQDSSAKEKPRPRASSPQIQSGSSPSAGAGAEVKRFKEEPAPKEKPSPKVSSSQPKGDGVKEKRPYSNIDVIMYMTSW